MGAGASASSNRSPVQAGSSTVLQRHGIHGSSSAGHASVSTRVSGTNCDLIWFRGSAPLATPDRRDSPLAASGAREFGAAGEDLRQGAARRGREMQDHGQFKASRIKASLTAYPRAPEYSPRVKGGGGVRVQGLWHRPLLHSNTPLLPLRFRTRAGAGFVTGVVVALLLNYSVVYPARNDLWHRDNGDALSAASRRITGRRRDAATPRVTLANGTVAG